ncbi:hypothetical protein ACFXTN_025664 [Malus domestica]
MLGRIARVLCGFQGETTLHLVRDCPSAICGWLSTPLRYPDRGVQLNSMEERGTSLGLEAKSGTILTYRVVWWAVWVSKNDVLWKAKMVRSDISILEQLAGGRTT